MKLSGGRGPTFGELRPMHLVTTTSTFPVYQDLTDRMVGAADPDEVVRHVLATCSGYAYSDDSTLAMILTRLGLDRAGVTRVSVGVDAMFICSTAYVIQSADGRLVIVCYRGTEPANIVSWLTDLDVDPHGVRYNLDSMTGDEEYYVHAGFYRNVRASRFTVIELLMRALEGRRIVEGDDNSVAPLEALYVTGHSLGGAMAALLTVMLHAKNIYAPIAEVLRATYTYGQPMIGSDAFAQACQVATFGGDSAPLGSRLFRYVYGDDVVPQLPPRQSGSFGHFGQEFRCRPLTGGADRPPWELHRKAIQQTGTIGLALSGLPLLTRQFKALRALPFSASLADHTPHHYVDALMPANVRTEFGD